MSQNLDATAINQIHALISAQGVNEIISKIGADAVALPENFRIHDLEKFNLNRFISILYKIKFPSSVTCVTPSPPGRRLKKPFRDGFRIGFQFDKFVFI